QDDRVDQVAGQVQGDTSGLGVSTMTRDMLVQPCLLCGGITHLRARRTGRAGQGALVMSRVIVDGCRCFMTASLQARREVEKEHKCR
ncbi:MAG TPA: hypothetical protein VIG64_00570, partial [Actinomycetota bacterium]